MIEIPEHPEILLTRKQAAAALRAAGYPISASTLATKASRPTPYAGPPYRKFGNRPLYRLADLLTWARSRLGPPVTSTSEAEVIDLGRAGARTRLARDENVESKRPAHALTIPQGDSDSEME
jgi:hypothetical protein